MGVGSENVALEYQRYGRNKDTLVNKTYIDSGEYRKKFDKLTDNPEVNKSLYECAKKALRHRSGTELEDMYWIDGNTGEIVAEEINSNIKRRVNYSNKTQKAVSSYDKEQLITIHTHPSSMPPSIGDFNACYKNGYKSGYIACHDGKIFGYTSKGETREELYNLYINEFISNGHTEYDAQILALTELRFS
jgi:hypothetical protein